MESRQQLFGGCSLPRVPNLKNPWHTAWIYWLVWLTKVALSRSRKQLLWNPDTIYTSFSTLPNDNRRLNQWYRYGWNPSLFSKRLLEHHTQYRERRSEERSSKLTPFTSSKVRDLFVIVHTRDCLWWKGQKDRSWSLESSKQKQKHINKQSLLENHHHDVLTIEQRTTFYPQELLAISQPKTISCY